MDRCKVGEAVIVALLHMVNRVSTCLSAHVTDSVITFEHYQSARVPVLW